LAASSDISGMVLADHESQYLNTWVYNILRHIKITLPNVLQL
jgi:hypothetical protein